MFLLQHSKSSDQQDKCKNNLFLQENCNDNLEDINCNISISTTSSPIRKLDESMSGEFEKTRKILEFEHRSMSNSSNAENMSFVNTAQGREAFHDDKTDSTKPSCNNNNHITNNNNINSSVSSKNLAAKENEVS